MCFLHQNHNILWLFGQLNNVQQIKSESKEKKNNVY